MASNQSVLVFGPTGAVGCAAAVEARKRGAHVWLAMRDTTKSIQGLDSETEGYTRIQADLTKPDTLKDAVSKSGAKIAFVYTMFNSPDFSRASFQALKNAGITYVVILSSYVVHGSPRTEANSDSFIGKLHAKTEISLLDVGIAHAAVRPAYFNSNVLVWYLDAIRKGQVDILYPNVKLDYIAPSDIGKVCGAILANPEFQTPDSGSTSKAVDLCGPELLNQHEAMRIIAKVLGREIKVNDIPEDEWFKKLEGSMPRPVLDSVADGLRKGNEGEGMYPKERYEKAVANMRKYLEAEPMTFEEWVEQNKAEFA